MSSETSSGTKRPRRLTDRQLKFIDEYLLDFEARPAAVRAGFSDNDCKAGHRLIRLPRVQEEIQRRCLEARVRLEVTGDHIRQGFAAIAFDPREPITGGPTRTERMTALRELGKLLGMYVEKHLFAGTTLEDLLAAVTEHEKILPPAPMPLRLIEGGKS